MNYILTNFQQKSFLGNLLRNVLYNAINIYHIAIKFNNMKNRKLIMLNNKIGL